LSAPTHAVETPSDKQSATSGEQKSKLSDDPGSLLKAMAAHLDADPNFVVVKVENLAITNTDLAGVIRSFPPNTGNLPYPDVYRRALDIMIQQKAMVLNARLEHLDQDPAVRHRGEIALERVLADAWLTRRSDAAVTEKALRERYEKEFAGKPGAEEVRARIILVPSEAAAVPLIDRIRGGADFGDVARAFSKDPTAAQGGDLGYLARDATTPELAAAMFSLAPGQVTPYPVATRMGYFIIRVEGRRTRDQPTFEETRFTLESELRSEAVKAAIGALLTNLKVGNPEAAGKPKP
jgi:peptidyl-prolyl cis-trans isomerase C